MAATMAEERKTAQGRDRRAKFVTAESRTTNAMRAIRVIGKLANRSHYEYDDADVKKIIGALTKEIEALRTCMSDRAPKETIEFKL
jgi:hypothetical protein